MCLYRLCDGSSVQPAAGQLLPPRPRFGGVVVGRAPREALLWLRAQVRARAPRRVRRSPRVQEQERRCSASRPSSVVLVMIREFRRGASSRSARCAGPARGGFSRHSRRTVAAGYYNVRPVAARRGSSPRNFRVIGRSAGRIPPAYLHTGRSRACDERHRPDGRFTNEFSAPHEVALPSLLPVPTFCHDIYNPLMMPPFRQCQKAAW